MFSYFGAVFLGPLCLIFSGIGRAGASTVFVWYLAYVSIFHSVFWGRGMHSLATRLYYDFTLLYIEACTYTR